MADLPTGTVTFLFTDIEGSTRLWEQHPRAMADLARDTLPPDVTLRDLGERHLRDLRPEPVFQLVTPDLPSDFPPLKTLDRPAHNLPVPPTPLIGRTTEVVAVRALLGRADL